MSEQFGNETTTHEVPTDTDLSGKRMLVTGASAGSPSSL